VIAAPDTGKPRIGRDVQSHANANRLPVQSDVNMAASCRIPSTSQFFGCQTAPSYLEKTQRRNTQQLLAIANQNAKARTLTVTAPAYLERTRRWLKQN